MPRPLIDRALLSRRDWLRFVSFGAGVAGLSPWMPTLAETLNQQPRKKHCILLWMTGGPSQTDTFDMKPNHPNGGPFKEIATSVPGLRFSEHLPKLAQQAEHLAILRGMSTREGDHGRGTYLMRTGRTPGGPVEFPTLGSVVSKELGTEDGALPQFASIASNPAFNPLAFTPGFLGPKHAPLVVETKFNPPGQQSNFPAFGVDNLAPPPGVGQAQARERLQLLEEVQREFLQHQPSKLSRAHTTTLNRSVRLINGSEARVFDLSEEPPAVREQYGPTVFGQGCLLARRLIEKGVAFVEVSLGDAGLWDTHRENFPTVQRLSQSLDAGWSSLLADLNDRGLLESTTILWMGEFGRTPQINSSGGRDHFPSAWTSVLAGGGIQGGQAHGKTSDDGQSVLEGQTDVGDLLATLCAALGLDPRKQNLSDIGRPFRLAEGKAIGQLLKG